MALFFISVLAGVLTILSPCILPLLPIVIGSAGPSPSGISKRAITVIASLSVSVMAFTLLLKATTLLIDIPQVFWMWFSGGIIMLVGVALLFPRAWNSMPFASKLYAASNKKLAQGYQEGSFRGDVVVGAALGPVFTSCSPTYFFILGTVLPAQVFTGLLYLIGFVLGLALSLCAVAYAGQKLINAVLARQASLDRIKMAFGILFLLVGVSIITGFDKRLSAYILESGYGATIRFEQTLIDKAQGW